MGTGQEGTVAQRYRTFVAYAAEGVVRAEGALPHRHGSGPRHRQSVLTARLDIAQRLRTRLPAGLEVAEDVEE